jgi:hypothetical protein
MRKLTFSVALGVALLGACPAARAQVSDAERAAARQLFKDGDDLQHQGQLALALDKFQRAQQVFNAPSNLLRIAQCQAGLGKLVEATETYRALARTVLTPGSPPAFQTAIDQGNTELPQVEPRVPKVVVVAPPGIPGIGMQIDGQSVPPALIGAPLPLDPGPHTIVISAPGFATAEQRVVLQERDTKTIAMALRPLPPAAVAPPQAPPQPPPPLSSAPQPQPPAAYASPAPPPPPPPDRGVVPSQPPPSRTGLVVGLHLGDQLFVPGVNGAPNLSGAAYALDGGLRFGRNWYVGLTFEHAGLSGSTDGLKFQANTTTAGVVISLITNPDRVSFYLSVGGEQRWYNATSPLTGSQSGGEGMLATGVWIPIGSSVRLLPELIASFGTFSGASDGHQVYVFAVAGFYNLDL